MSDQQEDQSSKTEEPTERKLDEARKKGNVASSREVGITLSTLGLFIVLAFLVTSVMPDVVKSLLPFIENPADISGIGSTADLAEAVGDALLKLVLAISPVFIILFIMGLLSARAQGEFVVSAERIKPKLQNVSPLKGFSRIYSLSGLIEFVKSVAKVGLVSAAGWVVISSEASRWIRATDLTPDAVPTLIREGLTRLLLYVVIAMVVITILDILWKRFDHRRKLRMSMREIKEEIKQTEGDPMIKAKVAEIRRSRARKRMMAAVPTATVVIANPTHFAVALKYERYVDEAPICVAKGVDAVALKIREVAEENDVPVIENPPLARMLHSSTEIDAPIPFEHFKAVAEIISYIYRQQEASAQNATE